MDYVKPRLKLSHSITRTPDGQVAIGELAGHAYIVRDAGQALVDLLLLLDGTRTLPRILRALQREHPVSEAEVRTVLDKLAAAKLLDDGARESTVLSSAEIERYDRQQLQFSAHETHGEPGFVYQERLKSQVVCVLGMGGWGTWMALNLALSGFGTIRVVDADHVELSNLNRQVLYDDSSVGLPKVLAAKTALNRINPHVHVDVVQEFIEPDRAQVERVLEDATLVCLCWANQSHFVKGTAEEVVHRVAFERGIPILEIAGDPFDIAVGPLYTNDGSGPCLRCVRPRLQKLWWGVDETISALRKVNVQVIPLRKVNAWQSAPSLSAIAGLAANEALTLASGYAEPALIGKRYGVSLRTYETTIDQFDKDPDCPWCAETTSTSSSTVSGTNSPSTHLSTTSGRPT
ncbi:ThiF family adenylyltransferase [Kibdelosporangium philippinense]|uniref:ThiF family adenylyltransferase n=1 Tax=Kibdelosporangium philippinense TaxID=211113 RepID=A0ABS8Z3K3_9PSEU|nr:ThiF family adenylyltransferase [Kibdelosporangium philippinense]MCE7002405.1 ThiF family adenylyltransferase [Kibdelosporangium philippinense]